MKKAVIYLLGLVVILVAAVVVLPRAFGLNMFKSQIAAAVAEATGRELRIDGDIELAILPALEVAVTGVHLSNAAGAPEADMLSLAGLSAKVALWPLLTRRIEVERLLIQEPVISLHRSAAGEPNWIFAAPDARTAAAEDADAGPPSGELVLQDVRLEGGRLSFVDAASGQEIQVRDIGLTVALPSPDAPLTVAGEAQVNDQSVRLEVMLATVKALLAGQGVSAKLDLVSAPITAGFEGQLQQQPLPGLDGQFQLEIPSVGALASWLGQPLAEGQPDPGPVKLQARFKADGSKIALDSASLEGEGLRANASGSFDGSGEVAKAAFKLEGGVLDLTRYLPPRSPGARQEAAPMQDGPRPESLTAALPDTPFDLTLLRQAEVEASISLDGLKTPTLEFGRLAFAATLEGGVLAAELSELALYGGAVTANIRLDGSGESLGLEAQIAIDQVEMGELSAAAGDGPAPVSGLADGRLELRGDGTSPRALAESLSGELVFELGAIDVEQAPGAKITEIALNLDLPGLQSPPSLTGALVYNRERVAFDLRSDPLAQVLSGDAYALDAKVSSARITARYQGRVQQQPVPGLDGTLELDIPSVGLLAAWLDRPLDESQPDPGPLKVRADLTADGKIVTLESATIQGEALDATASGSFDGSGEVAKVVFQMESGLLDIDRYLPPPAPGDPMPDAPAGTAAPADLLAGLSDQPIDMSALRGTEADVSVTMAGLRAAGFEVGPVVFAGTLKDSVLTAELRELGLYGGNLSASLRLDGSAATLALDSTVEIANVAVAELLAAATGGPAPAAGSASGRLAAKAAGASARQLATSLSGDLAFTLAPSGTAEGPAAALTGLEVTLQLPGLESPSQLAAGALYKDQRLDLDVTLDPLQKILAGERFAIKAAIASELISLGYDGSVQQQPMLGLDGEFFLDIKSLGELAAWLDQPLDPSRPDPGPLRLTASLAADEGQVALKDAVIEGKAVKARASGSFDGGQTPARFMAALVIEELDLDSYLPPGDADAANAEPEPAGPQGWSEEPFDLGALRRTDGEITLETGALRYRGLRIVSSRTAVNLAGGVLAIDLQELVLADGKVGAKARLDGSGEAAAVTYQVSAEGVQAKPLLAAFAGTERLSGSTNLEAQGSASGRSQKELVGTLDGTGRFTILDGAIEGIDLAAVLRNLGAVGAGGEASPKTDFAELSGSFEITKGLVANRDLQMLAPLVRLSGAGDIDLPPRTLDYGLEAKLVASLEGQGGDKALAGLPIPIRAKGPWDNLSYEVDWASVFRAAALDPTRLQNMPGELQDMAKGLGVDLPIPDVTGGGAVGGILKALPGLGGGEAATEDGTDDTAGTAVKALEQLIKPTTTKEPEATDQEEAAKPSPVDPLKKTLKGLFGN